MPQGHTNTQKKHLPYPKSEIMTPFSENKHSDASNKINTKLSKLEKSNDIYCVSMYGIIWEIFTTLECWQHSPAG